MSDYMNEKMYQDSKDSDLSKGGESFDAYVKSLKVNYRILNGDVIILD